MHVSFEWGHETSETLKDVRHSVIGGHVERVEWRAVVPPPRPTAQRLSSNAPDPLRHWCDRLVIHCRHGKIPRELIILQTVGIAL